MPCFGLAPLVSGHDCLLGYCSWSELHDPDVPGVPLFLFIGMYALQAALFSGCPNILKHIASVFWFCRPACLHFILVYSGYMGTQNEGTNLIYGGLWVI